MLNSLTILSKVKDRRRVAILGDILELGKYSKEIHEKIGKSINSNNLDLLITIGNNSTYIKKEAINNNFNKNNIYSYDNYQTLKKYIKSILKPNDIVLIKASHGMELDKIVDYLIKKKEEI